MTTNLVDGKKKIKDNLTYLIEKGSLSKALDLIREYEAMFPNDVEVCSMKAVISIMEGELGKAEGILKEGLTKEDKNFDLLYNLAYVYQSREQFDFAAEYYKKALHNAKDDNDANRANEMLQELGCIESKAPLRADSEDGVCLCGTEAPQYRENQGKAKALDEMGKYKKQFKENIQSLVERGLLQEAKAMISEYEKLVKEDIDIYSITGVIAMMEEDLDGAERIFKRGIDIQPLDKHLLYNLAFLYETQGKYVTSYRYYKKLLKVADHTMVGEAELKIKQLEGLENVQRYKERKKALIIAYAFPPIGGSGIQRTLKFVNYLRDFGWEPIVLTVGETSWTMKDESLLKEIPNETEVIRINDIRTEEINNSFAEKLVGFYSRLINDQALYQEYIDTLKRETKNIGEYLFIPEYQSAWAVKVCEDIQSYIDVDDIDVVYTSADPYADTFIGYSLKERFNKPWVADFRDEWTNHHYKEYDKGSIRYRIEYKMEEAVVKMADKIITTTPISSDNYRNIFGLPYNKVETITNGYDEKDFEGVEGLKGKNKTFSIMHNGIFHDGKNPITFLQALSNLINKKLVDKREIKVYFTREDIYLKTVNNLGLQDVVEYLGYVEHKRSLEIASKCDALLLVVGYGEKLKQVHAAKLFEYLRLGKPILSLAPSQGVIDNLINELKRGYNVEYNDVKNIEEHILKLYKDWKRNQLETFNPTEDIKQFERRSLTKKLSDIFESICKSEKDMQNNSVQSIRKKIVFFSKGDDKFIWDIINELSNEYETKKITITKQEEFGLINQWMQWADISWFEWCDELIIYGSGLPLASDKKIICRLHSYEAFTNYPSQVNWECVDEVIFVAEHIRQYVIENYQVNKEKTRVIPNGVKLENWSFKQRKPGFNVAYVGYINYKKGPMLLLHTFKALYDKDKRYKLYIAGQFQDPRDFLYFKQMIKEFGLENNFFFEGWQDNLNKWLEDKNFILCTSILESQNMSVMQAMAKGIKPIIHNFVGAKDIYPEKYVWNTVNEAVEMISKDIYNSSEYRQFIEENYFLEDKIKKTGEIIAKLSVDKEASLIHSIHSDSSEKPLVTIGIINYNCSKYLNNCVESFLNQTYSNIEILIIDDCSTDGSREMIKELEGRHENIRAIYHEFNSGGPSKAIREIISQAQGKYFQWIASDDYVAIDAIEKFVNYLENSETDYVYCNYNIVDDNNDITGHWNYSNITIDEMVFRIFSRCSGVVPMNGLYKTDSFHRYNINWIVYRDNDHSCDTINSLHFAKNGMKYGFLNENLIYYRVHNDNHSHNIEKRINTSVSVYDYIIKSFDETVYFPNVEWEKYNNRMQFKNYIISLFYYNQIERYMRLEGIPAHLKGTLTKEKMSEYIKVLAKEGLNYISESLTQGDTYKHQITELNERYKQYL